MAVCLWCDQEMLTADDCTDNRVIDYPDGTHLPAIPYQHDFEDETNHRCHDCNVKPGNYHHPGCDMEECPRCHGQLISCGCLDKGDEYEEEL